MGNILIRINKYTSNELEFIRCNLFTMKMNIHRMLVSFFLMNKQNSPFTANCILKWSSSYNKKKNFLELFQRIVTCSRTKSQKLRKKFGGRTNNKLMNRSFYFLNKNRSFNVSLRWGVILFFKIEIENKMLRDYYC